VRQVLESAPGLLTDAEAELLFRAARHAQGGAVVNIGPILDKTALALAMGVAFHPPERRTKYFCVIAARSHAHELRGQIRMTLARHGQHGLIDLINIMDATQFRVWREPIATLCLEASNYSSMRIHVDEWLPHVTPTASILIKGPVTDSAGRRRLISELCSEKGFAWFRNAGNTVELRRVRRDISASDIDSAPEVVARYIRSVAASSDPSRLIAWLHAMSFVSLPNRYVYISVPKAACTTLKYFIAELEHAPCHIEREPYLAVTKLSMRIHQRRYIGVPTVIELNSALVSSLLSGESGFFIFSLVRNPFSRVVAAFENRIRLCEPGFDLTAKRRWAAAEAGADVRAAFAGFVSTELEEIIRRSVDYHFIPQNVLLGRPVIPYTKIFQIERFSEFEQEFSAHLRGQGAVIPEITHLNRSLRRDWRHYYDQATADRVFACYEADFASFGYDLEGWRTEKPAPDMRTTAEEAYWRMEVIERNEMIAFMRGFRQETGSA
jgi:sulfotransferase famil protein